MPLYHATADAEFDRILASGNRDVKTALGMLVQRHARIDGGKEPLSMSERLPASGPNLNPMYKVTIDYGAMVTVDAVYEKTAAGITLLALDARSRGRRVGQSRSAPDAISRAWSRAS